MKGTHCSGFTHSRRATARAPFERSMDFTFSSGSAMFATTLVSRVTCAEETCTPLLLTAAAIRSVVIAKCPEAAVAGIAATIENIQHEIDLRKIIEESPTGKAG